jgi:hypothetical protein
MYRRYNVSPVRCIAGTMWGGMVTGPRSVA